ncbi:uncharacterized protein BP01DRAFT_311511 [Aspergillus saccharolyticus JOP 1030-1]|uniref:Regulator of volume decrease after cellular swelling-domain-containing protein n=1 Tax=Aspergillus saccharolyticus JOP 1030-1 TaxID=1450539 RepID=A0A318ZQM8_9EURO|nr:hypothetical protein BP01DRAFT_311511 [Aspergillus saccharolyticus JOP 1030-1]PYH48864.1 hypothetical protein BP01DRAFT_311511 [Aspergillus saccharolyticus JOP 1030-1]
MEPLTTPPNTTIFTPLAEHQSRTPSSFHTGPPILHYHRDNCKLVLLERDLLAHPTLRALHPSLEPTPTTNGNDNDNANHNASPTALTTEAEVEAKELALDGISVWVTSDKFLLYSPSKNAGLAIPYPSISLHAIQRLRLPDSTAAQAQEQQEQQQEEHQGLYMQIAAPPSGGFSDDEEECTIMTLVPLGGVQQSQAEKVEGEADTEMEMETETTEETQTPTQALYAAVSACSNLHPDPVEPGDEEDDDDDEYDEGEEGGDSALLQAGLIAMGNGEGGLPPPMDGSSGWITAENMHEFFDEEGNWIGGGQEPSLPLGPGAGTVRQREDGEDGQQDGDVDGEGESEETKWRRTD